MNKFSWLIYWADVVGSLDIISVIILVAVVIGTAIWTIIGIFTAADSYGYDQTETWRVWRRAGYLILLPLLFISTTLAVLIPSKETVYAIAASEMGERALHTPTADRAFRALNSWMDHQIADDPSANTNGGR